MDPVSFLGLVAAIITIADAIEKRLGKTPEPNELASAYMAEIDAGRRVPMPGVTQEDITRIAEQYISIKNFNGPFIDRIKRYCIQTYQDAIDNNPNDRELDDAYRHAQQCVCRNIGMARRHLSPGGTGWDDFSEWFDQFNCLDRI
ncbi:hypothetical protein [Rhizobium sp. AP16]|uniref:hypothetical protein n=1 Tax=Rhizobium sp. AP16 TaxID=1144306 RepID=UPI00026ED25A|nr:hypothetical protein [Rhizobium sp. AP16]EJK83551.1 hypothetical protein PMI03_03206 [Rhizobium sp. AP16]